MPTMPRNPSRSRITTVRLRPDEHARFLAAAAETGQSVSEIIRRTALGRVLPPPRPPQVDSEMVTQLRRIGVNLNQAVAHFNRWNTIDKSEKAAQWKLWRTNIEELGRRLDDLSRRLG